MWIGASSEDGIGGAFAQIASGYIHEMNNKLGPILLEAEVLAMNGRRAMETAADIARNAMHLRDMVFDLELLLMRDHGMTATDRVRLVARFAHGTLRKRRLRMETSSLPELQPVVKDASEVTAAVMLVALAFRGPEEGEPGVLEVTCSDRDTHRTWMFDVEPKSHPDERIVGLLSGICLRNGWDLGRGEGWISIELSKEVGDARR